MKSKHNIPLSAEDFKKICDYIAIFVEIDRKEHITPTAKAQFKKKIIKKEIINDNQSYR